MSGLEILGAVSASVQLAGTCCTIGERLLRQRSESILINEIHEDCRTLLSEINKHILNLSPESRQAAQELADRLQKIKHKSINKSKRVGFRR